MSKSSGRFSFGDLIFFGISSILGSGVFLSTAKAYQAGSYHVIWIVIIGSIIATIMALAFAEMGGRFTKTGGVYLYAKEAFGKGFAFNIGLLRFIILGFALAAEATAIPNLLQDFSPMFGDASWSLGISGVFILFLFAVNFRGVSSNAKMAKIIEIVVLSTIFVFIVTSLFHLQKANFVSTLLPDDGGSPGHLTFSIFSSTFILLFYSFLGFENIGTGAQDMENPRRDIPRAIILTMAILGVMYFFIFIGITGVLGPRLLTVNNAIGAASSQYLGPWAEIFVSVVCIIAIIGIGLSQMYAGARSLSPIAEDEFFSKTWSHLNSRGVPVWSLLILSLIAFAFVLFGKFVSPDAFVLLVSCTTIGRLLQYMVVSVGILVLRKKEGQSEGYHMKFALFLVPLVVLFCLGFIFSAAAMASLSILILIIFCVLVYFLYSGPRERRAARRKAATATK